MDYNSKLSQNLQKALDLANRVALKNGVSYVGSEHLIYGFLSMPECTAYGILAGEGASLKEYERAFLHVLEKDLTTKGLTPRTKEMFAKALKFANAVGEERAGTVHFLYAVLEYETCYAVKLLNRLGADIETLKEKTEAEIRRRQASKKAGFDRSEYAVKPLTPSVSVPETGATETKEYGYFSEKKTERKTAKKSETKEKFLSYGIDLTERAKKGKIDPVIGRRKEIEQVVQILSRRSKNNPVLVGEPGVGKSAIAEGLARLIAEGDVPEQLYNKTVFSVDIPGMLAGAKYRGDFEERLKDLVDTVMKDGDVVLFIDEIHNIVGAGSSADNSMDAANILKPMLARGDLQVIGATTVEEYRKYIEKDGALVRRFTAVNVEEPTEEDAVKILQGLRSRYEQHHGICISDEAIEAAVRLSSRYITDRFLPDKAIDLIDEAAAHARIVSEDGGEELNGLLSKVRELDEKKSLHQARGEYAQATELLKERAFLTERIEALKKANSMERGADGRSVLGKEQIAAIVSERTKIPLLKISQAESEKLLRLETDLHRRIIGQNEAVGAVAKAIRRARAGLKDPSRPIGSFIFVGPTGVGKTDLCKALSEALFGTEEQMIRLDMSEYMEKQSISKLIGAAPGYVGYDDLQTGQLTEKVRSNPYSVVLFDEIEKAHSDVFNLLLQILDDGRLTDNKGRTVSFKNAVIILTSNVGAAEAETAKTGLYGFGGALSGDQVKTEEQAYDEMKERISEALKKRFRPEFLNRLDDIIVFHKLSREDVKKIGEKLVGGLSRRLYEGRGITLAVSNQALERLVDEGYDPKYGARPLKRVVQRRIEDKLSEEILLGRVQNGQRLLVDFDGKDFTFTKNG